MSAEASQIRLCLECYEIRSDISTASANRSGLVVRPRDVISLSAAVLCVRVSLTDEHMKSPAHNLPSGGQRDVPR